MDSSKSPLILYGDRNFLYIRFCHYEFHTRYLGTTGCLTKNGSGITLFVPLTLIWKSLRVSLNCLIKIHTNKTRRSLKKDNIKIFITRFWLSFNFFFNQDLVTIKLSWPTFVFSSHKCLLMSTKLDDIHQTRKKK